MRGLLRWLGWSCGPAAAPPAGGVVCGTASSAPRVAGVASSAPRVAGVASSAPRVGGAVSTEEC